MDAVAAAAGPCSVDMGAATAHSFHAKEATTQLSLARKEWHTPARQVIVELAAKHGKSEAQVRPPEGPRLPPFTPAGGAGGWAAMFDGPP